MEYVIKGVTYGLIVLCVPVFLALFYRMAKLFGIREYTPEEIEEFSRREWPPFYKTLLGIVNVFSVIWLFASIFISVFAVMYLQITIFPSLGHFFHADAGTLLFRQLSDWPQVILFFYFFAVSFITLIMVPLSVIPVVFRDLEAYTQASVLKKKTHSSFERLFRLKIHPFVFLGLIIFLWITVLPLAAVQLNSYITIAEDTITVNRFMDWNGRRYTWDDVDSAVLTGEYAPQKKFASGSFILQMRDETDITVWTSDNLAKGFTVPSRAELRELGGHIRKKGIDVSVDKKYTEYLQHDSDESDREKGMYILKQLTGRERGA